MEMTPAGLHFSDISEGNIAELLDHLNPYSDAERLSLPRFVMKTSSTRFFLSSTTEAVNRWRAASTRRGAFQTEEAVLQPFLLSPDRRAQRVRVTWERGRGTKAELFTNQEPYFKLRKTGDAKVAKKSVTFADVPGEKNDQATTNDPGDVDEAHLFITPFADVLPCRISQSTSELNTTIDYVKNLMSRSVLSPSGFRLLSLSIDMMLDVKGKWYFIGIEAYQMDQPPLKTLEQRISSSLLGSKSKPPSRASCPTSRYSSPIPEITVSPPVSECQFPRRGGSIDSYQSTPKAFTPQPTTRASHARHSSDFGFHNLPNNVGPISDKKLWKQTLEMEHNIADLIDLKSNRPISFVTYRAWKQRQTSNPSLRTIDILYAKKLAEKAKDVRKDTAKKQQELANLRTRLLERMAVASVTTEEVTSQAGKVLLERVQCKKSSRNSVQLTMYKTKMLQRYQQTQNLTAGDRSVRTILTYASKKMDYLKERCREIKEKSQESSGENAD